AETPDDVLPRFVDLALEITGGVSAGLSLYEPDPAPGVFRWQFLRGTLSRFEDATTPRDLSPRGVTLDENAPVLARHPERHYSWISEAGLVVPEVMLVPLYIRGIEPLGTLWIVSETEGHFARGHARAMTELSSFVGIALRMRESETRPRAALDEQAVLAAEMDHRIKNLFALTDGMIRAGARTASDVSGFARGLSGRLRALASAHALVSRDVRRDESGPARSDLRALVATVAEPYQEGSGSVRRVEARGPEIICGHHTLNALALVLHELTTNAAKYGALAAETGRVEVRWRVRGEGVELVWSERRGPPVIFPPEAEGFGGSLVRRIITGQLGGTIAYRWRHDGLEVTLTLPLRHLEH
ncbi:HWE histidine kinase domain-containing protein, partial [Amaricoccus solimangrovi]